MKTNLKRLALTLFVLLSFHLISFAQNLETVPRGIYEKKNNKNEFRYLRIYLLGLDQFFDKGDRVENGKLVVKEEIKNRYSNFKNKLYDWIYYNFIQFVKDFEDNKGNIGGEDDCYVKAITELISNLRENKANYTIYLTLRKELLHQVDNYTKPLSYVENGTTKSKIVGTLSPERFYQIIMNSGYFTDFHAKTDGHEYERDGVKKWSGLTYIYDAFGDFRYRMIEVEDEGCIYKGLRKFSESYSFDHRVKIDEKEWRLVISNRFPIFSFKSAFFHEFLHYALEQGSEVPHSRHGDDATVEDVALKIYPSNKTVGESSAKGYNGYEYYYNEFAWHHIYRRKFPDGKKHLIRSFAEQYYELDQSGKINRKFNPFQNLEYRENKSRNIKVYTFKDKKYQYDNSVSFEKANGDDVKL